MRCKKHLSDLSSSVGVCATCLRDRLAALVEAQAQARPARVSPRAAVSSDDCPKKSDPNPPPLNFPRSVSPYVSRRKSDYATARHGHDRRERLFYSTPQVGPTFCGGGGGGSVVNSAYDGKTTSSKKRLGKFWILSNLFRSRSNKLESDPRISSQESCEPSSSTSPSWFSMILPARRQRHVATSSFEDSAVRGMTPVTTENFTDNCNGNDQSPSGSDYSTESSPQRRMTAVVMPPPSARRSRLGLAKNVSGMAFCLSPLVRVSPNRDLTAPGAHLATAASFCANRSRKFADFGKVSDNR